MTKTKTSTQSTKTLSALLISIKNLFNSIKSGFKFEGSLKFAFPMRQQKMHEITIAGISLQKPPLKKGGKKPKDKRLRVCFRQSNEQTNQLPIYAFDLFVGRNKTNLKVNALLPPAKTSVVQGDVVDGGKSVYVESLKEEQQAIVFVSTINRIGTSFYDEVMSYFFGETRPKISVDGKITINEKDADISALKYFANCLSNFWPRYNCECTPPWLAVSSSYRMDNALEGDSNSESGLKDEERRTVWGIATVLIAFLRKFIINGVFIASVKTKWDAAFDYLSNKEYTPDRFPEIFTKKSDFDLNPSKLKEYLEGKQLFFKPALLDTICSALNSGDNIILTGGPGCGKTTLAKEVIDFSGYEGIVTTASSAWTTDELIGRYIPHPSGTSTVLSFQPGYFIEAIKDQKWLLIDEMNRAPIDLCFGELFTVLAGQSVELPFFANEDEDGNNHGSAKRVWIVAKSDKSKRANVLTYNVDSSFRLLCTMNDVDKDKLEQLSFALQRRFHIIRMDSPSNDMVGEAIKNCWASCLEKYGNLNLKCIFNGGINEPEALEKLFFKKEGNLLSRHVISVAQVMDIIRFALRRCHVSDGNMKIDDKNKNDFILTGLALGIVTKVYPQLQNFLFDGGKMIENVIKLLVDAFGTDEQDQKPQMVFVSDSNQNPKTILQYLQEEFEAQFKSLAPKYSAVWSGQQGTTR